MSKKRAKNINRAKENEMVVEFQKTKDMDLLQKIYIDRIPTLMNWANKHYYPGLDMSVQDLFSELSLVFLKAAEKYDKDRGHFNTCLYNFLLNRLKNIKNSKHAKKRVSQEYKGPKSGMILSLDYIYSENDGADVTLKDIIPSKKDEDQPYSNMYVDETLNVLSKNDKKFKEFLKKLGEGYNLTNLIKEYKTKKGKMKLPKNEIEKIKSKNNVLCLLKQKNIFKEDFEVLDYEIYGSNQLKYEVELKKTKETDKFIKSIKEIRSNKREYREKINSVNI